MMVIAVASNEGPESSIVVVELERKSAREVLTRSLPNESEGRRRFDKTFAWFLQRLRDTIRGSKDS